MASPTDKVYSGIRAAMPFNLILFDLDGTLVDSAPDIATALNTTLKEAGFPPHPPERVLAYIGDGATKLVQRALPSGAAVDMDAGLVQRFRSHYADHICDQSRLYPGIADLLAHLAPTTPMAIWTNKPGDLARSLISALAIGHHFRDIIGDGDGFPRKPAVDGGLALITRHHTTAAKTLFVGDGIPDILAAHALGCPVAAATWGYVPRDALVAERPDWLIESPGELLDVLSSR
jgi:phosphoglycolate phosphatase